MGGQLIDILGVEVVPDVVVARSVIASKPSRKGSKNSSGRKLKEPAVRDFIHATAERVIDLSLQPVAKALHGSQLEAVVVAVRARGKLSHSAKSRIGRL